MSRFALDQWIDIDHAFEHPLTLATTAILAIVLGLAPISVELLSRTRRIGAERRGELLTRWRSWAVLVPLVLVPILLGANWVIAGVGVLSLLCHREFARATGLFREKLISLIVVLGILALSLAAIGHRYELLMALTPLTVAALAVGGILADRPEGYIQRIGVGVLAFVLFGTCLGHLSHFAMEDGFRPTIILVILAVQANDVFAFVCGRLFGRCQLAPNTSPNKTVAGALGALILTTLLVLGLGVFLVPTPVQSRDVVGLMILGMILSVAGQMGDLMMSSIKRDLGLKDMGRMIPGHGGLLDRFDSLVLAAPAAYYFLQLVWGPA